MRYIRVTFGAPHAESPCRGMPPNVNFDAKSSNEGNHKISKMREFRKKISATKTAKEGDPCFHRHIRVEGECQHMTHNSPIFQRSSRSRAVSDFIILQSYLVPALVTDPPMHLFWLKVLAKRTLQYISHTLNLF